MKRTIAFFLAFLISALSLFGQNNLDFQSRYRRVKALFDNDMFISVEEEVNSLISEYKEIDPLIKAELSAYKIYGSIKLQRPNIDALIVQFEDEYPFSSELTRLKFHQSVYYFDIHNYTRSLEILSSIDKNNLPGSEKLDYDYNVSYCNLRVGNNEAAASGFYKIYSLKKNKYTSAATYYIAYLDYINRDFRKAIDLFGKLVDDNRFSMLSRYYLVESYFMLKDYNYVTQNGKKVMDVIDDEHRNRLARMLSEAFFALDKPEEAMNYFDIYSKSGIRLSRKDIYYAGAVAYSLGSYFDAIDAFGKVVSQDDSLGQTAYYNLGNSYLKIKNKHNALAAYKAASECSFDGTIKEDAFFLYAKLAFDVNSDISAFNNYLEEYPSSSKSDEIYDYIGTAYLLKKDYRSAISAIGNIKNIKPQTMLNLQKAAFFRAMQLLDRGSYTSAISNFSISIEHGSYNEHLRLLAQFWMAEALYRTDKFKQTININLNLVKNRTFVSSAEYPLALFNLGYAYFREAQYEIAIQWFDKYLSQYSSKKNLISEAKTRVADSYFMLKDYNNASEIYLEVADENPTGNDVYAKYQGAIAYGLISQDDRKIELLSDIVNTKPNSVLYHRAIYELGRAYVQVGDSDQATSCFLKLSENQKDSVYFSKALLELGMINSNLGNYEKALSYFDEIIKTYPLSEEAHNALVGMEVVYQMMNKPDEFLAYLDRMGMSSVKTADEKEQMLFDSAERIFLSKNYQDANKALENYLAKYPEGVKKAQAYFYLGECWSNLGKKEAAANAYKKVMDTKEGSFAELSTLYYGRICMQLERYENAIEAFETLSLIAKLGNNRLEAMIGKMDAYFKFGNYSSAVDAAKSVISFETIPSSELSHSKYIMAKSLLSLGERSDALPILEELSKYPISSEGAECAYLLIMDAFDEGNFEKVEGLVYALSDSETPQEYWRAKSFIVLGDSFAEREEWEQASATFMSIKEGYEPQSEHDDVLDQVEMRLNSIPQLVNE